MSIGSRIKEKREELKITQVELAKMVGVSKGSIGNYESGVSAPNEKILYKLFSALKCDANYLYQDDLQILSNKNEFIINTSEKETIKKYRTLDEYGKKAVDDLLDTEYERCKVEKKINDDYVTVLTAARSNDNRPIELHKLSKEKLELLKNAKSVEDESDL